MDDGSADPRLAAALATFDTATPAARARTRSEQLAALVQARVFAAITAAATATELTGQGLRVESSAEMSVIVIDRPGGVRALPLFSDLVQLGRWNAAARPVPLTGGQACAAAADFGASFVIIDPAGGQLVLEPAEVQALAGGWVPVGGTGLSSRHGQVELRAPSVAVPAELVEAVAAAVRGEGLRAARLLEGPDGLVLGVCASRPLDPAALAALAQRVLERLGPALPGEGLSLAQVPRRGRGLAVIRRWFSRFRR